ncbi:unnamed protein product [Rotaria socialis]|uniref:Uncharacterized protein n=1 Tax=Rotaria socialis TaxID=392032 RepID=A0A817RYW2_9BILA|nr:unnamed protein product [Rotaria socialis]CAF3378823.1 unnamed protein product [Rotaria socialis]CAF4331249.1 unnamed protein product [Rotaria socialis]
MLPSTFEVVTSILVTAITSNTVNTTEHTTISLATNATIIATSTSIDTTTPEVDTTEVSTTASLATNISISPRLTLASTPNPSPSTRPTASTAPATFTSTSTVSTSSASPSITSTISMSTSPRSTSTSRITISTSLTTLTSTNTTSTSTSTAVSSMSTTATAYTPDVCRNSSQVALPNGTCVSYAAGQEYSAGILHRGNASSVDLADALSLYVASINNANMSRDANSTVSINIIEESLRNLNNTSITISSDTSFLIAHPLNHSSNDILLGARFQRGFSGASVTNSTKDSSLHSNITVAAVIAEQSLLNVKSLQMFIIDKPTMYENVDNKTNKSLASSVVIGSVQPISSASVPMNISLYFKISPEYQPNVSATYLCSFYDISNSRWNETGCTNPLFNPAFSRYECSCNHLTSFALIWLPQSQIGSYGRTMRAADIASLVFQSVSIVCFLIVIIHSIAVRAMNPSLKFQAINLLPLISAASTTILFIFYIALGMTVYTQTPSENETKCFLNSSVLMFFVYFLLIFMFCTKTSIGYFNYLRFVHLFHEPKLRLLYSLLIISFLVSITWVSFAAGFNANASFSITQLYPYQLCWFTHDVIYYFMTIPVCLFLLLNIFTIIFVSKHIIAHARNATTRHQSYERMKQCVLILLSSCVTQGIGWLFGPFISFVSPTGGDVLEWFFIIFNGLEGVWSIILYIIILSQRMEEQKRVAAGNELTKILSICVSKGKKSPNGNARRKNNAERENLGIVQRNMRKESMNEFDGLNENVHIDEARSGSVVASS